MNKEHNLLNLLSAEKRKDLIESSEVTYHPAGTAIFERGKHADRFYVVKKGQIKLIRITPAGDEKVFKVFMPKGVIAEMAIFMPIQQYPMTAIAEVDSELIEVKKESFLNFIKLSPDLAIKIMSFMSHRISFLVNTIDTLTQVNAEQRLVMYLAQLYLQQQPEKLSVCLPFSKKVLANQICVKPETLSRMLRRLKNNNLIIEKGRCWEIPDVNLLCHSVGLLPDIFLGKHKIA